tara:strand:- start:9579 stop:9872 length:294 start_codon:yes stop_codon:yes gene_type:complete
MTSIDSYASFLRNRHQDGKRACSHPDCYQGLKPQPKKAFHFSSRGIVTTWCKKCCSRYNKVKNKQKINKYWEAANGVWWLYQYFISSDLERARARRK